MSFFNKPEPSSPNQKHLYRVLNAVHPKTASHLQVDLNSLWDLKLITIKDAKERLKKLEKQYDEALIELNQQHAEKMQRFADTFIDAKAFFEDWIDEKDLF